MAASGLYWRAAARQLVDQPGVEMQISERTIGEVTVVDVSGKVTLGEGGDTMMKDKLRSLVHQGRLKLLLNLADVSYVDSAGLGAIVQSYTTVTNQGGALKLVHLTKRIKDLLAITKLITVFETYDSEAEAVASF
jgi:anti-sigma B factor antagonist